MRSRVALACAAAAILLAAALILAGIWVYETLRKLAFALCIIAMLASA